MKTLTKCIFDMDGLLIDTEKGMWFNSERKAFAHFGKEVDTNFLASMMGISGPECKKIVLSEFGEDFPYDEYISLVDKYNAEQIERGEIYPMPGVYELLDFLKENKVECVVGTGTRRQRAIDMLKTAKLFSYFSEITTSYDVPRGKPNPDIFLKCLGETDKESALVFEDSKSGSLAAINAGIKLVIVPDVAKFSDEEKSKAFKVINRLDEAISFIKEML